MSQEARVCIDLWPSHGKRVVVATTQAELDAACAAYSRLPWLRAAQLRYETSVRLFRFDLGAPHSEDEWSDMHCDVLALACLRHVTQNKPLPIMPPPTADPEATAWVWRRFTS